MVNGCNRRALLQKFEGNLFVNFKLKLNWEEEFLLASSPLARLDQST